MWYLDLQYQDLEAVPGQGFGSSFPDGSGPPWVVVFPAPGISRPDPNSIAGPSSMRLLHEALPTAVSERLYLTALVKQPQNLRTRKVLTKSMIRYAGPELIEELQWIRPKRILAVGAGVAEVLCPGFQDITEDHGALFMNPTLKALVVPTYTFSTLGAQPQLFRVVKRDLERWVKLSIPEPPPYQVIQSVEEVDWQQKGRYVLDIETTGFDPRSEKILSVGFKDWDSDLVYIWKEPTAEDLVRLYEDGFKTHQVHSLTGHNLQFDLEWLFEWTKVFWNIPIVDTMMMAHNSGEESLKLKHLTTMYTDRPGSHAFGGFRDDAYLAEDVLSTQAVHDYFAPIQKTYIHRLMNKMIPVAAEIRWKGVPIDYAQLLQLKKEHEVLFEKTQQELDGLLPKKLQGTVNWNAPAQVIEALRKSKVKLTEKTGTGAYTVKESVLLALKDKHPIVAKLLEYREQEKLREFLEQYAEKLGAELQYRPRRKPRLHPRLKMHGTRTGRTSMEDPNLQQVTRTGPLKLMFISSFKNGRIALVDLSQAELRGACLLSGDRKFALALMTGDVHEQNARIIYKIPAGTPVPAFNRKKSKGVTFGLLYGGGAKGLAARLGIDPAEVEKIIDILFKEYPDLNRYIRQTKRKGIAEKRIVDHFGRIRDLSTIIALRGARDAERKAINTPIQGLASHISLLILGYIFYRCRELGLKSRVLFGVHDSTIIDVHPLEQEKVAQVVQEAFESLNQTPLRTLSLWGTLPIVGELIFGTSWATVESTNEHYGPEKVMAVSSHPNIDLTGGRKHDS